MQMSGDLTMALFCLTSLLLLGNLANSQETATLPVKYNVTQLQGDGEGCPMVDQRDAVRAEINQDILTLLQDLEIEGYGTYGCGGIGWSRVAYLNMTDSTQQCPPNWNLYTSPIRSCGRSTDNSCDSTTFSVQGLQYSQVCGRIVAYQYATTDAFYLADSPGAVPTGTIDGNYVDGVSITHGNPKDHVWTFAAALDELDTRAVVCPCTNINYPIENKVPSFVGDDYFCETGVPSGQTFQYATFYSDDPLWDGQGCGPSSTCCTLNNPPWFFKQLSQPTTNDLEVRICGSHTVQVEDSPIELIELYIK